MASVVKKAKVVLSGKRKQKSSKGQKRNYAANLLLNLSKPGVFKKRSKQVKRFFGVSHRAFGPFECISYARCLSNGHFDPASIEAGRLVLKRILKKRSQHLFKITIFPSIIFSRKPKAVRMGKGKGVPKVVRAHARVGKIFYKITDAHPWYGRAALSSLSKKLPVPFTSCSFSQPGCVIRL